jgi:Ser-tRNA(Ala) deacylase AlaX
MINLEIEGQKITIDMSMGWKYYGQYNIVAYVYNQKTNNYAFHSTDSELYDNRKNDDINNEEYQKMLFNAVETELIERIKENIYFNEDNN